MEEALQAASGGLETIHKELQKLFRVHAILPQADLREMVRVHLTLQSQQGSLRRISSLGALGEGSGWDLRIRPPAPAAPAPAAPGPK